MKMLTRGRSLTGLMMLGLSTLITLSAQAATPAATSPVQEVDLPDTRVIAVRTANGTPPAYAEAFGKLVGYYAQTAAHVKVVFPQRSVTIHGASYAAVAIDAAVTPPAGVELLTLPHCHFLSVGYTGNYEGIGPAIDGLVNQALSQHRRIDQACGVRIHHLNSPDDTPIDQLRHVLYVPVTSAAP